MMEKTRSARNKQLLTCDSELLTACKISIHVWVQQRLCKLEQKSGRYPISLLNFARTKFQGLFLPLEVLEISSAHDFHSRARENCFQLWKFQLPCDFSSSQLENR